MKNFLVLLLAFGLLSCHKNDNGVQKLIKEMSTMSVEEKGHTFARKIVVYCEKHDTASAKALQDTMMIWGSRMSVSDRLLLESAITEEYGVISKERHQK